VSTVVKRALVGRPLANAEEQRTRLPKRIGLAVFASDAISSTAYATEEILVILLPVAGLAALDSVGAHLGGGRGPAGDRHHQLPADHPRLPRRGRRVRRRA
jgi:hypothetical protein